MLHEFPAIPRWSLVVVTTVALTISLVRLGRHSSPTARAGITFTGCETDAGHGAMLASMLVMFAAPNAPISVAVWRTVFTIAVICSTALLVAHTFRWRAQHPVARRIDGIFASGHHLVMAAAMLYMTFASAAAPATPHPHHAGLPLPVVAWTLVVVLTADALRQILVAVTLQTPGRAATKLPTSIRITLIPPTIMDAAMVVMLTVML